MEGYLEGSRFRFRWVADSHVINAGQGRGSPSVLSFQQQFPNFSRCILMFISLKRPAHETHKAIKIYLENRKKPTVGSSGRMTERAVSGVNYALAGLFQSPCWSTWKTLLTIHHLPFISSRLKKLVKLNP